MRAIPSSTAIAIALLLAAVSACGSHPPATPRATIALAGTAGGPATSRDDLNRTIAAMRQKLAKRPGDPSAAVQLADALLRQTRVTGNGGLANEAERALFSSLKESPDDFNARRMLGAVYLSEHRFRDAIREGERCRALRPGDAWTDGVLGDAHLELGDYNEAFAAFDRMIAERPNAASYARASYARELQGDLAGALRLMHMATEATSARDPEALAWHHAQLGHLQIALGHLSQARREYEHAEYVFPGHPFAAEGLARVDAGEKKFQQALDRVVAMMANAPSPAALAFAGDLLTSLGRRDEAEQKYRLAEASWMSDAPEPARFARFLADHSRRLDEALRLVDERTADRHDIFTEDTRAWLYFQAGRIADAQAASKRALRTGTRDRDILRHAAVIAGASTSSK